MTRYARLAVLAACSLAFAANGSAARPACKLGKDEACPVVLKMKPGATVVKATGRVSGEQPDYYFKFVAKAGQSLTVNTVGGGLKTGPGIPITGPNGLQDAVFEDMPYKLPTTGAYVIDLHANTMSEGPFGRFQLTLKIK